MPRPPLALQQMYLMAKLAGSHTSCLPFAFFPFQCRFIMRKNDLSFRPLDATHKHSFFACPGRARTWEGQMLMTERAAYGGWHEIMILR